MQRALSLLITGGTVVTVDAERRVLADGAVAIDGRRIVEVGPRADLEARFRARRTIDAAGRLVLPGLVDVHLHHTQQLSRGLADDVDLVTWVYDRILPYEAAMTEEDVEVSALLSCLEMIRTGTTCASDPGGYHVDAVGRALEAAGLRGVVSWAGMDQYPGDRPVPDELPGKLDTGDTLQVMERAVRTWNGAAHGRLRAAYGLRTEPNVSAELFRGTKRLADRDGALIHIHAAVSPTQVEWMRQQTGLASIPYLADLGVLDENWILAHVAAIDDADVELLAAHGAKVAHQPAASTHGTYGAISRGRIPELVDAGVTVGLGCDANSAGNSLDMFRAIYLAATLHKEARLQADLISPEQALEMATIAGAQALQWDDEIGSLEAGKRADVIVVDTSGANWVPLHDFSLIPTLAYSGEGRDVVTSVVDGEVLMEERRILTLDAGEVLQRAQVRADAILRRLPYRLRPRWPQVGTHAYTSCGMNGRAGGG